MGPINVPAQPGSPGLVLTLPGTSRGTRISHPLIRSIPTAGASVEMVTRRGHYNRTVAVFEAIGTKITSANQTTR